MTNVNIKAEIDGYIVTIGDLEVSYHRTHDDAIDHKQEIMQKGHTVDTDNKCFVKVYPCVGKIECGFDEHHTKDFDSIDEAFDFYKAYPNQVPTIKAIIKTLSSLRGA